LVEREAAELRDIATRAGAELDVSRPRNEVAAAVQPELADRLVFRLMGALVDQAQAGERLQLTVDQVNGNARISISRPATLRGLGDSELFDAGRGGDATPGFSLRLVRGLARIAGGDLSASRDMFALIFPRG
jgi:hypothetical protein